MIRTGADRLLDTPEGLALIRGRRWALLCHGASIDSRGRPIFDRVVADPSTRPAMLLVPEHGLFGEHVYMEPVPDSVDPRLGIPVVSLYGHHADSLAPAPGVLRGLDLVVCDLQDVGARYYTYLATMAMTQEACSRQGIAFAVLDRPNPIGCLEVEGNLPDPALRSFVSWLPLANRHGMTAGEVARMHASRAGLDGELHVLRCDGLDRRHLWPDTGLPFVPPSPNIPTWETALVYPGMCLLEGTNLSEGRGTTTPFHLFGAPWVRDPWALVSALESESVPGAAWRPTFFRPCLDKWSGERCGGAQLLVTDVQSFRPLHAGMAVVAVAARLYPDSFVLRTDAYEFVDDQLALDLLLGDTTLRMSLLEGADVRDLVASLAGPALQFRRDREEFLLYG